MPRFVVKAPESASLEGDDDVTSAEPLADTGLFVVDASDPRAVLDKSDQIAWAAPMIGDAGEESYPTGEVSIRFQSPLDPDALDSFAKAHAVELRRRNEFIPEQVVVAPTGSKKTWLPDLVSRLNDEGVVAKAWPNTLSRYRRD